MLCSDGLATYRSPCLSCEQTDAGSICDGGTSWKCAASEQCAPELECSASGYCIRRDAG